MAFNAIIVGAGIIGASIAWRLSQSGLRVLLLDAARMGGEASSAGAGMLAPGGEIEQPSPWIDLAIESLRSYPAFIAELEEQTGCQIDFECLGAVELAPSPREWQALEGRARRQSALARHDLRQYVPLARQDVVGAWFYRPARPDGRVTLRLPGEESGNPGRSPRDSPFARAQIP